MQERYLGDSHDFVKYALLRYLHRHLNIRIGVNWYLTERTIDHPSNNDGEQRHHLNGGVWARWDAELFDRIKVFESVYKRTISTFHAHCILPVTTTYFEEVVPTVAANRRAWHERSLNKLASSDLVFLDPDNGFKVKSARAKTLPKYALYNEAVDYYRQEKIVIAIQFARQCSPENKARDVKAQLYEHASYSHDLPVLRARMAPNILFLFLAPQAYIANLTTALKAFADGSESKAELIIEPTS